jgi:hypothetical protein
VVPGLILIDPTLFRTPTQSDGFAGSRLPAAGYLSTAGSCLAFTSSSRRRCSAFSS